MLASDFPALFPAPPRALSHVPSLALLVRQPSAIFAGLWVKLASSLSLHAFCQRIASRLRLSSLRRSLHPVTSFPAFSFLRSSPRTTGNVPSLTPSHSPPK